MIEKQEQNVWCGGQQSFVRSGKSPAVQPTWDSTEGFLLSGYLVAVAVVAMSLFGIGVIETFRLAGALISQFAIGAIIARRLLQKHAAVTTLLPLWFGIGSLVTSIFVLVVTSLGASMRVALKWGLAALPPVVLCATVLGGILLLDQKRLVFRHNSQFVLLWQLFIIVFVIIAAVDWRLICFVLLAAGVYGLGRTLQKLCLFPLMQPVICLGVFWLGVVAVRQLFLWIDIDPTPMEFAMWSDDVYHWTGSAWSMMQYGPFQDVLKIGTMSGYHVLSAGWVAAVAEMSGLSTYVISSFLTYLVFGLLFVAGLAGILRSLSMVCTGHAQVAAGLLATGSLSSIELKSPLSPESLTQFVAFSWLVTCLLLFYELVSINSPHWRFGVAGLLFGWIYFAKVSVVIATVGFFATVLLVAQKRQTRTNALLTLVGFVATSALVHLIWLFPARNDASFGEFAFTFDIAARWMNFLSDGNFHGVFRVGSLLIAVLFFLLVAIWVPWNAHCRNKSLVLFCAGLFSLVIASVLSFGAVGNGESYVWAYGTFFSSLGMVLALLSTNVWARSQRRLVFSYPLVLGMFSGIASGIGLWISRVAGGRVAGTLGLIALLLAMIFIATKSWRGSLNQVVIFDSPRGFRIQAGRAVLCSITAFFLSVAAGQHVAYALREPVLAIYSEVTAGEWTRAAHIFSKSKARSREDFAIARNLECLRDRSSQDSVIAVYGVSGRAVVGIAERALYVDPDSVYGYRTGSVVRAEVDRRVELVRRAARGADSFAVNELRLEGVTHVLIGKAMLKDTSLPGFRKEGECSSQQLLVWEI